MFAKSVHTTHPLFPNSMIEIQLPLVLRFPYGFNLSMFHIQFLCQPAHAIGVGFSQLGWTLICGVHLIGLRCALASQTHYFTCINHIFGDTKYRSGMSLILFHEQRLCVITLLRSLDDLCYILLSIFFFFYLFLFSSSRLKLGNCRIQVISL